MYSIPKKTVTETKRRQENKDGTQTEIGGCQRAQAHIVVQSKHPELTALNEGKGKGKGKGGVG